MFLFYNKIHVLAYASSRLLIQGLSAMSTERINGIFT